MTRSAADAGAMLGVIAGTDPKAPTAGLHPVPDYLAKVGKGAKGLRVGVDLAWNETDDEPKEAVAAAIEALRSTGAEIREVIFPDSSQILADWSRSGRRRRLRRLGGDALRRGCSDR